MSKEFGDKLRAIRKDKRWSLAKMAEFLGTNKQTLSRYERNERDPKISDAAAFSEKLGIPLDELTGNSKKEGATVLDFISPVYDLSAAMSMVTTRIAEGETRAQIREREHQDELKLVKIFRSVTKEGQDYLLKQAEIAKKMFER